MAKEPKTLDELFHDTLKDIYFAEKKILATLPKMAKAAQNGELKAAFEKHRDETEGQVERLDQVFAIIDKKPQGKTCAAIVGITKEGAEIMQSTKALLPWMPASSLRPRLSSTTRFHVTALCALGQKNWATLMRLPFFRRH